MNCMYVGIIPAYAGNTHYGHHHTVFIGDHPRVCGEHNGGNVFQNGCEGSSPRMRGTPSSANVCNAISGIIPAYAGNTRRCATPPPITWDHPRVCGEHSGRAKVGMWRAGSSPRMRGTRLIKNTSSRPAGIIPAYAGNTAETVSEYGLVGDHPRVCGEHAEIIGETRAVKGSSPRMRGTLQ